MRISKIKKVILQWIVPIAILIILLIVFIIIFVSESEKTIDNLLRDYNEQVCYSYSKSVRDDLLAVAGVSKNVQNMLKSKEDVDNAYVTDVMETLVNMESVQLISYCYGNGNALLPNGRIVKLENTSYFKILEGDENFFTYIENNQITGEDAFLYVSPVAFKNRVAGYLLTYMSTDAFESIFEESPFMEHAFFAIVDDAGTILSSYGYDEGTQLLQDNFWNVLESNAKSVSQWNMFKRYKEADERGVLNVRMGEEERTIYLFPIEDTEWKLVAGVNVVYGENARAEIWKPVTTLVIQIVSAFTFYILVVVGINLLFRIQTSQHKKELENKADTDLLTDLNNKIATERKIKEYMQENPKGQAVMFIIDVDNFKKINDTLGHAFGDEVLRQLGMRLQSMFRVTDIIGRVGGDEFIVFLKDVNDMEHIEHEGRKLEQFFHQFEVGEYVKYSIGASIGGAIFSSEGKDFEELYKAADVALYNSKRRGKNCLSFYHETKAH